VEQGYRKYVQPVIDQWEDKHDELMNAVGDWQRLTQQIRSSSPRWAEQTFDMLREKGAGVAPEGQDPFEYLGGLFQEAVNAMNHVSRQPTVQGIGTSFQLANKATETMRAWLDAAQVSGGEAAPQTEIPEPQSAPTEPQAQPQPQPQRQPSETKRALDKMINDPAWQKWIRDRRRAIRQKSRQPS